MTERTALTDLPTKLMHIADGALECPHDEAVVRDAADALVRLRSAATNLMAAIDNMHERGETFTARVSIAAADMRSALT